MCDLNAVILVKNPIHTFEKYWGLFVLQHNWKEKGDFFLLSRGDHDIGKFHKKAADVEPFCSSSWMPPIHGEPKKTHLLRL